MRNSVDIDSRHSRAIVKEIGERLRISLKEDRELPTNLQKQIEQLRELDAGPARPDDEPTCSIRHLDFAATKRRRHFGA